jgi:hypothetical protein
VRWNICDRVGLLRGIVLAAVLAVAAPLLGVGLVRLDPELPTTLTPVSVRFFADIPFCAGDITLTRRENTFLIDVPPGCFPGVPLSREFRVDLGFLRPGTYTYVVDSNALFPIRGEFTVTDAGPPFISVLNPATAVVLFGLLAIGGVWLLRASAAQLG